MKNYIMFSTIALAALSVSAGAAEYPPSISASATLLNANIVRIDAINNGATGSVTVSATGATIVYVCSIGPAGCINLNPLGQPVTSETVNFLAGTHQAFEVLFKPAGNEVTVDFTSGDYIFGSVTVN